MIYSTEYFHPRHESLYELQMETWFNGYEYHRIGGPAVILTTYNSEEWWYNGLLHRDDGGPAVINNLRGYFEWWRCGNRHREDGPAIIGPDGLIRWYLRNIKYSITAWDKRTNFYTDEELVLLKLKS